MKKELIIISLTGLAAIFYFNAYFVDPSKIECLAGVIFTITLLIGSVSEALKKPEFSDFFYWLLIFSGFIFSVFIIIDLFGCLDQSDFLFEIISDWEEKRGRVPSLKGGPVFLSLLLIYMENPYYIAFSYLVLIALSLLTYRWFVD